GPGPVTFTVDPNPTTAPRSGLMAIADGGQRFTVTQDAASAAAACVFQATVVPGAGGNRGRIAVSAPAGCAWTAQSNSPLVAVVSGASGAGDGVVTYRAAPRVRNRRGAATVTVAGQQVTVPLPR
ncbi:MAG: BACON domain-containing protein, partial [Acidobacteria bacterium]|nr:BACON domain-containing protein [Acidobacteriota bacterium]